MSAMDDIHLYEPRPEISRYDFRGFRDLLLTICLTILTVLALQAADESRTAGIDTTTTVQDWRGNSGSLPR